MKNIVIVLVFLAFSACGQESAKHYLEKGKQEFKKEFHKQNYDSAIFYLEKAVLAHPNSQEAHYYLGYGYDRKNSKDGKTMINTSLALTQKSSKEFEKVIEVNEEYTGEILILDPYSKITAIWGSLAMKYLYEGKIDSAKWTFQKGKELNGFSQPVLEYGRNLLNTCDSNSIVFTSGDNITIPLWYLQTVESMRKDVAIIDVSLLNTIWYVNFIQNQNNIPFTIAKSELDSVKYQDWEPKTQTIQVGKNKSFSWLLEPTYQDKYLLRGDVIMLDIIKSNKFEREIYFTKGMNPNNYLSLKEYIHSIGLVDRLQFNKYYSPNMSLTENLYKYDYSSLKSTKIPSVDIQRMVDNYRYEFAIAIAHYKDTKPSLAENLISHLKENIQESNYPASSIRLKLYLESIMK